MTDETQNKVECGTFNCGGAFHNGYKGRIPTLVFAGASPFTQEGELRGSRTEFIQWPQDLSLNGKSKSKSNILCRSMIRRVLFADIQSTMLS